MLVVWLFYEVSKGAKIRNRYNQVPHLAQDTQVKQRSSVLGWVTHCFTWWGRLSCSVAYVQWKSSCADPENSVRGEVLTKVFFLYWSQCMRFPTMWHLTTVDSGEPLQPPSKLRHSKWYSVSSLTIIEFLSD